MAVSDEVLRKHPGRNFAYFLAMRKRREVQRHNRDNPMLPPLKVPPQPNKYRPHQGAKETSRGRT